MSVQEKIGQIQLIQQNMENFAMQRQQFQIQQTEIETALAELDGKGKSYRIVGNIMVLQDHAKIKSDLDEKKETLKIRIETIEKQEEKLRQKFEDLQKEVMAELENKDAKKPGSDKTAKR